MKNAIKQLPNDVPALKKYISSLETNFINSQQANDHLVLTNAQLVEETKKLAAEKIKIESEFNILKLQNEYLWEQFKLSKQRRFGTSSEKNVFQGDLFDAREYRVLPIILPQNFLPESIFLAKAA